MLVRSLGLGLVLASVGCGQSHREPEEKPAPELVPGTCMNTDCSLPAIEPFQPAPDFFCAPSEGPPVVIEWLHPPSEVDCGGAKCNAIPFDVAAGASGEIWTSARLEASAPVGSFDPTVFGFELLRNAWTGVLELEAPTHTIQPLYDPTLYALGMSVDASGELDWVGPSPGTSGVSLMHYDRSGARVSSRWMIQHAEWSAAVFGGHGITLSYGYVAGVDASLDPPVVNRSGGIARFDAKGHIAWSQSALDAPSFGVASDGSTFVASADEPALLARLAPDGHVLWVRSLDGLVQSGAWNRVNGQLVLWKATSDERLVVDSLDEDGNSIWRVAVKNVIGGHLFAISQNGQILLADVHVGGTPSTAMLVVSADGTTCTYHSTDESLFPLNGAAYGSPDERFAFTSSAGSGVMSLP